MIVSFWDIGAARGSRRAFQLGASAHAAPKLLLLDVSRLVAATSYRQNNMQDETIHEVVQIGYGPVGQVAAALLGRAGHDVAVFERHESL